jgi:hypothetical protein
VAKHPGRPKQFERRFNFLVSKAQDKAMKLLQARHGTPPSETARRALDAYLKGKGVLKKTKRK